ncbi:hypothetical protein BJ741DRAFT_592001 [Chytriomyces cf. hyalinus JEL632]|nr:hypothetical protein BJ741DRAFT_592001 [Chytriomyces cf. hyalinus JEL632]
MQHSSQSNSPQYNAALVCLGIRGTGLANAAFADVRVVFTLATGGDPLALNLHRVVLCTSRFFRARFDMVLAASGTNVHRFSRDLRRGRASDLLSTLSISVPPGISRAGVAVVLERIYGQFGHTVTDDTFSEYLAAAYFFADQDLCDQCALYIKNIAFTPANIPHLFSLASSNDFGPYSELLLRNCLAYLCKEGTTNLLLGPAFYATTFDYDWLARIVCSDVFYVRSEVERFEFLANVVRQRKDVDTGVSEFAKMRAFLAGSAITSSGGIGLISPPLSPVMSQSEPGDEMLEQGEEEQEQETSSDDDSSEGSDSDGPQTPVSAGIESTWSNNRFSGSYSEHRGGSARNSAALGLSLIIEEESVSLEAAGNKRLASPISPTAHLLTTSQSVKPVQNQPQLAQRQQQAAALANSNPQKRSFKQRRDDSHVFSSAATNSTESAIETISNGVIYTHVNSTQLAKLRVEGVISPLVLGLQFKAAADLSNRIKKSNARATTLGIKYLNDRQGITSQIKKDFDEQEEGKLADAADNSQQQQQQQQQVQQGYDAISASNQMLCFYDWVFMDPFRHKLSEVSPFRFADEFPLAKVVGSKSKVYSKPVAYAGSLWYLMVRNESVRTNGKLGLYIYRKQDRKISGYTDFRSQIKVWGKVCTYIHSPQHLKTTPEPYVFETMATISSGSEAKFVGDANRISGEDLMTELIVASGGVAGGARNDYGGGVLRCCVVLALF